MYRWMEHSLFQISCKKCQTSCGNSSISEIGEKKRLYWSGACRFRDQIRFVYCPVSSNIYIYIFRIENSNHSFVDREGILLLLGGGGGTSSYRTFKYHRKVVARCSAYNRNQLRGRKIYRGCVQRPACRNSFSIPASLRVVPRRVAIPRSQLSILINDRRVQSFIIVFNYQSASSFLF